MAMTLEDVLGRNTQQVSSRITQFPSYEEFNNGRTYNNAQQQPVQDTSMNDYDYFAPRPYTQPMSTLVVATA